MKKIFWLPVAVVALLTSAGHGQSVLSNGDFEQADPTDASKPAHWDKVDGLAVSWTNAPDAMHGKAIRMDTAVTEEDAVASYAKNGETQWVFPKPQKSPIGETYGESLYSEAIPVVPGKTYRVTFDYMSEKGTGGKLWFRGYSLVNEQEKRLYEGNVDCGGSGGWKQFTGIFHPTKHTPNVTEFKIMLFATFPDGVAWWDNIKVEAIDEPADP